MVLLWRILQHYITSRIKGVSQSRLLYLKFLWSLRRFQWNPKANDKHKVIESSPSLSTPSANLSLSLFIFLYVFLCLPFSLCLSACQCLVTSALWANLRGRRRMELSAWWVNGKVIAWQSWRPSATRLLQPARAGVRFAIDVVIESIIKSKGASPKWQQTLGAGSPTMSVSVSVTMTWTMTTTTTTMTLVSESLPVSVSTLPAPARKGAAGPVGGNSLNLLERLLCPGQVALGIWGWSMSALNASSTMTWTDVSVWVSVSFAF